MTQENVLSRAVEFAQTLVRVPSVSGTPATHDVIRAVEEILSRFSRSTSRIAAQSTGAPVLLAHCGIRMRPPSCFRAISTSCRLPA